jgi:hypothetical protein
MKVTDVNVILAFIVIAASAMAAAVWVSPRALDWVTTRLHARSKALTAGRAAYAAAWGATIAAQSGQGGAE